MPFTNLQSGWSSMGIPMIGGEKISIPNGNGKVLFVDDFRGNDGNSGESADAALKTIQAAINKIPTSSAKDTGDNYTIYVQPGSYPENLVLSGKNFVSIIGANIAGYGRPDIAPSSGKALDSNESNGLVLKGLRFASSTDVNTVEHEGNGYRFEDCVFDGEAQAGTNGVLLLKGDDDTDDYTASEGLIVNCLFRNSTAKGLVFSGGAAPANGVGCSDVQVIGCRFYNNTGADIHTLDNTLTYVLADVVIHGCWFNDVDKAVYLDMDQVAADTGMISGCYFADDAALDATKCDISGTSIRFVGNYNAIGVVDGSTFDN